VRIPRDLNGADLAKRLGQFGYTITRQSGSHMRLTRIDVGREQHLTIPAHKPLRVGTLRQILKDVADHTHQTLENVLEALG
jgi:predicted RNA binding protein YcfA (HicA-like mRNA interferase family)